MQNKPEIELKQALQEPDSQFSNENLSNLDNLDQPIEKAKSRPMGLAVAGVLLFVLSLSIFAFFLNQQFFTNKTTFSLDDDAYVYQITKCWETNPPTHWIQRFEFDSEASKHKGCEFKGEAIRLADGEINFDKWLDLNVIAEGKIEKKWGESLYDLSSVKHRVSQIDRTPTPKKELRIKKISDQSEEIIYSSKIASESRIVRWGDYLFFTPSLELYQDRGIEEEYNSEIKLVSYGLKTSEFKTVYQDKGGVGFKGGRGLSDLQIIDNTLFFTVSGYLAGGDTFWLDSQTSQPKEVIHDMPLGTRAIEKMNDAYWLLGGEGDSCWSEGYYYLLNIKTKRASKVAHAYARCEEPGEMFLGIDQDDRVLMAMFDSDRENESKRYSQVYAIPIKNPSSRENLLSDEEFPKDIKALEYDSEENELLFIGEEALVLDVGSNSLKTIVSFPKDWDQAHIGSWKNGKACISENYSAGEDWFVLDSVEGTFEKNTEFCSDKVPFLIGAKDQKTNEQKKEDLIKALDLSSEYEVSIEVVENKILK